MRKASTTDYLFVLTHEAGHCIGLGHPSSNYSSIMSYAADNITNLTEDDMAGISSLYPDPAFGDPKLRSVIPCGVVENGNVGQAVSLAWLLLPLLGIAALGLCDRVRRWMAT